MENISGAVLTAKETSNPPSEWDVMVCQLLASTVVSVPEQPRVLAAQWVPHIRQEAV